MVFHCEHIGGALVTGNSTKGRAQNHKNNNFNPSEIKRHIAYIDARLQEYNTASAKEDSDEAEKKH
jgi:hypothetical protein